MNATPDAAAGRSTPRPRSWNLLVVGMLAATVIALVGGVVLAAGIIKTGEDSGAPTSLPKGPFGTSQDIPTSFGVVAVENAQKVNGTTAKAVAGNTHGISGFVPPNKVQIEASVTLTNLLGTPVAYDPRQFRLLVGEKKKAVRSVKSNLVPGSLQPDASVDGRLSFVAPRSGSKLWVEFTDPGRSKPILIDLGRTGKTPENAFDGFHKGH